MAVGVGPEAAIGVAADIGVGRCRVEPGADVGRQAGDAALEGGAPVEGGQRVLGVEEPFEPHLLLGGMGRGGAGRQQRQVGRRWRTHAVDVDLVDAALGLHAVAGGLTGGGGAVGVHQRHVREGDAAGHVAVAVGSVDAQDQFDRLGRPGEAGLADVERVRCPVARSWVDLTAQRDGERATTRRPVAPSRNGFCEPGIGFDVDVAEPAERGAALAGDGAVGGERHEPGVGELAVQHEVCTGGEWNRSYQYDTLVSGPRMLRPSSGPPGIPQKQVDVTDAG